MIVDKSEGFKDAPPSYQHVLQSSSTNPTDSKANPGAGPNPEAALSSRPPSHTTGCPRRHNTKARTKAAPSSRWLPTSIFGLSKTAKQVRSTTQSLLRDLLSQARPSEHEWLSVLTSCAEACDAQGLNFSALLQEPFVEGHLPVYWAVLKRPVVPIKADHSTPSCDPDALVLAILDASLPLNPQSAADARLACMIVSDNALFVRLWQRYEGFSQRLGTDKMLLSGADTVDTVTVDEPRNGGRAFTVHFTITQFSLRMRVSKLARVEFIARGAFAATALLSPLLNFDVLLAVQRDCGTSCLLLPVHLAHHIYTQVVMGSGSYHSVSASQARRRGSMRVSRSWTALYPHLHQHQILPRQSLGWRLACLFRQNIPTMVNTVRRYRSPSKREFTRFLQTDPYVKSSYHSTSLRLARPCRMSEPSPPPFFRFSSVQGLTFSLSAPHRTSMRMGR